MTVPFSCGTQYADWELRNCVNCKKGYDNNGERYKCDIQEALTGAYIGDGEVSEEIWKRMGGPEHEGEYTWDCPEKEVEE